MASTAAASPAVAVRELSDDYCEFQLSGVDAAFANALRRVMIAEVRALGKSGERVEAVAEGREARAPGAGR
jgi:hypothetical protein